MGSQVLLVCGCVVLESGSQCTESGMNHVSLYDVFVDFVSGKKRKLTLKIPLNLVKNDRSGCLVENDL